MHLTLHKALHRFLRKWTSGGNPGYCLLACMLHCVRLFATPWTTDHQDPLSCNFPGKNTGVGCYFLPHGIFPTWGWNPHFLHLQADSLWLSLICLSESQASCFHSQFLNWRAVDFYSLREIRCCPVTPRTSTVPLASLEGWSKSMLPSKRRKLERCTSLLTMSIGGKDRPLEILAHQIPP